MLKYLRTLFRFLRYLLAELLVCWVVLLYYSYNITVWSAAPQTTLWGGPGPRFEPGTGGPEAGTLPPDHHTTLLGGFTLKNWVGRTYLTISYIFFFSNWINLLMDKTCQTLGKFGPGSGPGPRIHIKMKSVIQIYIKNSVSDPDSWVFWIRIQGLKKRSKMLNNHDIILLFSDFFNILSFNGLLLNFDDQNLWWWSNFNFFQ